MGPRYIGTVKVERLRIYANHGVIPQEAQVGNEFEVTVALTFDATQAMLSDRLDASINYAEVVDIIRSEMAQPSKLLEKVVCRIYSAIMWRFPQVHTGSITLRKLKPPVRGQLEAASFSFNW